MLLGSDPEFVFVGEEGLVRADTYYPRQVNGGRNNPEIGGDGHPQTVEIRPRAKENPAALVKEISRILRDHYLDVPGEIAWRAGSFCEGKTLGGHIHFGGGVPLNDYILVALDGVLAQTVICLEDEKEAKQRRASTYGKLSDIRTKHWGFEYRTLSSFIVSPELSLGVYALAKACVLEELENGPMSIRKLKGERLKSLVQINRTYFKDANKKHFIAKLPTIWEVLSRYRYWFSKEGKPLWKNVSLLQYVATNYSSWHTEHDLLHRWKIRDNTPEAYTRRFKDKKTRQPVIPVEGQLDAEEVFNALNTAVRGANDD